MPDDCSFIPSKSFALVGPHGIPTLHRKKPDNLSLFIFRFQHMKLVKSIAFILPLLFLACKKDDATDPSENAQKLLLQIDYDNSAYSPEYYAYDAQGRMTEYRTQYEKITMSYQNNEVKIISVELPGNRERLNVVGKLDAQGRITEAEGKSNYNAPKTVKTTFEYNADGYLTREYEVRNNGAETTESLYTYENGNLVKTIRKYNNQPSIEYRFQYGSLPNKINVNYTYDTPNTFTGKLSRNLYTRFSVYKDGKEDRYSDRVYTMDGDYPKSFVDTQSRDGSKLTSTLKYQ